MRWCIVAVGKSRLAYARAGISEYLARLRCFCTVETAYVKPSNPPREGTQLLSRSEGCFRLILDERGKRLTSRAFAEEIRKIEGNPRKTCALLVGGADGLSARVVESADLLWSLSPSPSNTNLPSSSPSNRSTGRIPSSRGFPTTGTDWSASSHSRVSLASSLRFSVSQDDWCFLN